MFKIISGKKWREMKDDHNKLVKTNINLTLDNDDLKQDIEIYLKQISYLQGEVIKLKKKYEKKPKKVVKKETTKKKTTKKQGDKEINNEKKGNKTKR